jgi:hypothetical protein
MFPGFSPWGYASQNVHWLEGTIGERRDRMNNQLSRVCLVLLACFSLFQTVSAETIRIRVLNVHNGRPVAHEKVSLYIRGEKGALDYITDIDGAFTVDLNPSTALLPSTEWWITCRTVNPTAPHLFSVDLIHNEGATDENTCGKAKSEVIRGTLTILREQPRSSKTWLDNATALEVQ